MSAWWDDLERVLSIDCGQPACLDEAGWALLARRFYDRWIREQLLAPQAISDRPDLIARWQRRASLWRKSAAAACALRAKELGHEGETLAWALRLRDLPGPTPPKEVAFELMSRLEQLERISAITGNLAKRA